MGFCPFCMTETRKGVCPVCGSPVVAPGSEEGPLGGEPFLEDRTGTFYVTEDAGEKLLVWWSWYPGDEPEEPPKEDGAIPPTRRGVYLGRPYLAWPLEHGNIVTRRDRIDLQDVLGFLESLPDPAEHYPFELVVGSDGTPRRLAGRLALVPPHVPGTFMAAPERILGASADGASSDYSRAALLYAHLAASLPCGVFEPPSPGASSLLDPDLQLYEAMRRDPQRRLPFSEVVRAYTPPSAVRRGVEMVGAVVGTVSLLAFGALLVYAVYALVG